MEENKTLKYNEPIEVTEKQYWACIKSFPGVIAHRHDLETKKFYIKVWAMKYAPLIQSLLKSLT
jgi:predicted RNase H-like HicB family nuclease